MFVVPLHGTPYDGHTLSDALDQVERIAAKQEYAFVEMGYSGHGCQVMKYHASNGKESCIIMHINSGENQ